ncbi:MAG: hypothetical protein HBSAPP03_01510 [Phycisphaerae bacterium]|nr:MAG: hypothetical protein HBSAPP03_01510 [Phycisphaerae bacterium]
MNDWLSALSTSNSLDDRRDRRDVTPSLARVDEALSRPGSIPWVAPSSNLSTRIVQHLGTPQAETIPGPWVRLRPVLALAAAVALGVSVYLVLPGTPTNRPRVGPTPTATSKPFDLDATYFTNLPAKAEPLALAVGDPLVDEARNMGEDTRRAAQTLLARLPSRLSR